MDRRSGRLDASPKRKVFIVRLGQKISASHYDCAGNSSNTGKTVSSSFTVFLTIGEVAVDTDMAVMQAIDQPLIGVDVVRHHLQHIVDAAPTDQQATISRMSRMVRSKRSKSACRRLARVTSISTVAIGTIKCMAILA